MSPTLTCRCQWLGCLTPCHRQLNNLETKLSVFFNVPLWSADASLPPPKVYFCRNMHFTDLLPAVPEIPFYLLFFLLVRSFCSRLKRQDGNGSASALDRVQNSALSTQGNFTQTCLSPQQAGFTSDMYESILGYENPSIKRTNKREGGRKKALWAVETNYVSKTGSRLKHVI